jgi:hypothetical protein
MNFRTDCKTRYHVARMICEYILQHNVSCIEATARQITRFHHLPKTSCRSISSFLNLLHSNQTRKPGYGFFVHGTQAFKKKDYPHHYTLELIDGAKGLL